MAKKITAKELDKIIRNNTKDDRYVLGDSLYLDVRGGSAVFKFRFKIKGKDLMNR